ncbi:unnamed protein product [Acanthoscelides obtectus]|uniref:Complex 1 LYR protein domain-containing protein n=1 Tax=Acanthoscelides obtectus TaxID=200917 RepID=A0A9P0KTR0_ACAOB|nr:unnamed protein product [Acanthoscelides obtectus]CAK1657316.1 Protein bcn92 [Acanthoscelides obtectus]
MSKKIDILKLYKSLMRESQKIPDYNFRNYALRKVRDSFKANSSITDATLLKNEVQDAFKNLDIMKRQAAIGQMYSAEKLVIENIENDIKSW